MMLINLQRFAPALEQFDRALQVQPDAAQLWHFRGNALLALQRPAEACESYRRAVVINPEFVEAHDNLGVALKRVGKLEEAMLSFCRAIKFQPRKNAGTYINLANTQKDLGLFDDALLNYRSAITIQPELPEVHNNLANLLFDLGRIDEAMASYQRALECKSDFAEAHNNLGRIFKATNRFSEAEASYRRALQIYPDFTEVHFNLGVILGEQGRLDEAQASYRRAMETGPDNLMLRIAQLMTTLPIVPESEAVAAAASREFALGLEALAGWIASASMNVRRAYHAAVLQLPFYLAYRDGNHCELLSRFGDLLTDESGQVPPTPEVQRGKPRIVIVSRHFCRHSVWDIITRGLLVNLDRSRFEIVLYHLGSVEDEETEFAKSLADIWRDGHRVAGLNGWFAAMHADRPDVIFYPEVGMDPLSFQLASRRLAPLQVAGWGHPVTTGLPTIDLYFSGALMESPEADMHYRERLVRLPGTGCCTMIVDHVPEELPGIAADLAKREGVKFIIAQMPFKFDPIDDALFAKIAAVVGKCTFMLLSHPQFPWATKQLHKRLSQAFCESGLDPIQHLMVIPWQSQEKFYALLDLSDIYLDCPSFSGYTTAWMAAHRGLPIVTLEGNFMRQRLAAGLLRKIGMDDSIATSREDYVAIAVRLAAECHEQNLRDAKRRRIKAAAPQADSDISVVRAFEQSVVDALTEKGLNIVG
jgi:protein O-GlcNAc transferase